MSPEFSAQLALRNRPDGSPVMYQSWRELLFLHWRVDPAVLAPTLPAGLEIETFDGAAWLGVVPFLMRGIRPRFLPAVPGISNFCEMNLRTYVVDRSGRPGVWFYSLDANQGLAVRTARRFFHLPYEHARMSAKTDGEGFHDYSCHRRGAPVEAASRFRYRGSGEVREAEPGTLEFFLLERYLLYSHDPARERTFTGLVHHVPYPFQAAEVPVFDANVIPLDGLPAVSGAPDHVAYSAGVDVDIFPLGPA